MVSSEEDGVFSCYLFSFFLFFLFGWIYSFSFWGRTYLGFGLGLLSINKPCRNNDVLEMTCFFQLNTASINLDVAERHVSEWDGMRMAEQSGMMNVSGCDAMHSDDVPLSPCPSLPLVPLQYPALSSLPSLLPCPAPGAVAPE